MRLMGQVALIWIIPNPGSEGRRQKLKRLFNGQAERKILRGGADVSICEFVDPLFPWDMIL